MEIRLNEYTFIDGVRTTNAVFLEKV